MNAHTKWPAYTPAEARAMEDKLLRVMAREKQPNAGRMPYDYDGKYKGHGSAGGKKSTPRKLIVSATLQDKVLGIAMTEGVVTSKRVIEKLGVNDSTSRRVLRRMLDNGMLELIGHEPQGSKIYQAKA